MRVLSECEDPARVFRTFVLGTPRPKGSMEAQAVRGGGGRLTGRVRLKDSHESTQWRRIMALAFRESWGLEPMAGPVTVRAQFWFDPVRYAVDPREHPWPVHPHIGDLDKLLRNLLDALAVDETGQGNGGSVILNDRQVVRFEEGTEKRWLPHHTVGEVEGIGVIVRLIG